MRNKVPRLVLVALSPGCESPLSRPGEGHNNWTGSDLAGGTIKINKLRRSIYCLAAAHPVPSAVFIGAGHGERSQI